MARIVALNWQKCKSNVNFDLQTKSMKTVYIALFTDVIECLFFY